jgi:tetratricopeptide (TPR) repeat protein
MTQADLRDQLSITAGSYVFKEVQPKDILAPVLAELEAQIGTRAQHMRLEACRNAIQMNPQNELVRTKYVKLLMDTKDTNEALEQAKALAEAFPYSLEAQLLLARLFDTTGDKSRAVETLRLALEWCPDDAYPYMRLGQLLNEERRPEAALAAFRASFRLKPSAQAQSEIARILLSQDDISGAVNAYRHSLDLEPRNADVFEGLVLALCASDRLAEANGEMERWCAAACEKGNRITSLYKNNRQAQNPAARPMKDKALGARMSLLHELSEILPNGSDSVSKFQQFLRDKGGRMEAAGNLQGAINTYREAINIDPQNHGFILDLDKTLSTDQPADRRTLWETVRADNPGNARVTELCATARAAAGDMAGARQLLQTLPDNPVSTATFQSLFLKEAERLKGVGDPAGAVRACREAILLDPQNGQAIQLLDQALPKNSPTERRAAWESIWREKPDNPQVTAYCGVARAAAGDIAGAKQLFQALPDKPRSAPEFQEAFMDEGGRREAAGDLPGAISAYREAIPLAPRNDQPVERLEKVLSTGSPANRRGIWEAVWRENPDSPRVAARCGIARAAAGDIAGAKQLFQTLPDRLSFSTQFQGAFMDEGARREAAGDLPGAVDAYREAIPLYPENNQPVLLLEKAQMKCGPAERRSVWEAVWGDNLDNPHVAVFCGVARAATGDIAGAKSAFDAASRLMPGQWHFCELAADALADAGAWDDAVAAYACALALNPHLDYLLDRLHAAAKCAAENVHALENTAPSPAGQ